MLYRCWWNMILKYVQYHQLYGLIYLTISFKSPNFLVTKKKTPVLKQILANLPQWPRSKTSVDDTQKQVSNQRRFPKSWGCPPNVILGFFMMFHSTAVDHPAIGVPPWLRKPRPLRSRCCRSHRRLRPQLASAARSLVDRSQEIDGPGAGLQEWRIPLVTHKKCWFNVI